MIWLARLAAAFVGLFSIAMGLIAAFIPERLIGILGIAAASPIGENAVRADIGAFFLASAMAAMLALFAGRPRWLYGAAFMYGCAATLRLIGILFDGAPSGVFVPIGIEIVLTLLAVFAARRLPTRA